VTAARFRYEVFVPGEDLPELLETDVVITEGDLVTVEGREWLAERVELFGDESELTGAVHAAPPHEPA
jgi:hypothetical protein